MWGTWSAWEECPVTCGGANISRTRLCNNPDRVVGAEDCESNGTDTTGSTYSVETTTCNTDPCPGNLQVDVTNI